MIGVAAVLVVLALVAAALLIRQPEPAVLADDTNGATSTTPQATAPPSTIDDDTSTSRRRTTTTRRPPSSAPALWTPWSPPDRSFTIDFTGTPEVRAFEVDNVVFSRGTGAASQVGSTVYLVGWFDVTAPRYVTDSALVLNAIADTYAKESGLDFSHRAIGHFAGNPSLDFAGTVNDDGEEFMVRGLEIVAGLRVFLFVAGDSGDGRADFDHFRDSFHISP